MRTDDDRQCPHTLHLRAKGWGMMLRCTLNRGHRSDTHVGPIYNPRAATIITDGVTALEWRTADLEATDTAAAGAKPGRGPDVVHGTG